MLGFVADMSSAAVRLTCRSLLTALAIAVIVPTIALAQYGPGPDYANDAASTVAPLVSGIGAGLTTLLIGALLVLFAPAYTERVTDRAIDAPGATFLWGFGVSILVVVVAFVFAITIVGLVIAIPLVLVFGLFALVASEFGFLAAGRLVSEDWTVVVLVAVLVAVFTGYVPLLGGLVGFVLGSIGIGAAIFEYRDG